MSQALAGTVLTTSSAPRRATRSSPAASKNLTMAVFRPVFRQQRPQPQQRCGPRKACGPGMAFGAGPMGFTVNGRPMSAEDMMRVRIDLHRHTGHVSCRRAVQRDAPMLCCPALLSCRAILMLAVTHKRKRCAHPLLPCCWARELRPACAS